MKHLLLKYETQIALHKNSNRPLDRMGIVEISVLDYLRHHDEVTQIELIDMLTIKRSKAVGLLKKMMDAGYIYRVVNEKDRRSTFIRLAEAGKSLMTAYDAHEGMFLEFILKDMTINEEKAIVKFLSKINQTTYMK